MKETTKEILKELCARYPMLCGNAEDIALSFETVKEAYAKGNRLYLC